MAKKGKFANKNAWSLVSGGRSHSSGTAVAEPAPEKQRPPVPKQSAPKAQPKQDAPKAQPKQDAPKAKPKPVDVPAEDKPMTPLQKAWDIIKTILTYTIVALAVAMMIFTAVSMTSFDRNDRDIFGYKAFIVRSDSMSATDFSAGDLVIIQEVDPNLLETGDIIAFLSEDPDSYGETFTHKIRKIETDDYGIRTFTTYGTTTGVDDLHPVTSGRVLGQYRFAIPNVGTFFAFMKTTPGYICCIFLPFVLLLVINGGSIIGSVKQMYHEKEAAAEAEHQQKMEALAAQQAAIEAQQKQMEAMLQEMRELRKELYGSRPQDPA